MVSEVKTKAKDVGVAMATRTYGGVTAVERQAVRRRALLEAALDLIVEADPTAVTKTAVCARAGLTDRYFYEHFSDRDALLETLADEVTQMGIEAVVTAALGASEFRAQLRAAVDAALMFLAADPRRSAVLLCTPTTEVVHRTRLRTLHAVSEAISSLARELLPDPPGNPHDIDMAVFTFVSGTLELVAAWLRGEFDSSREHLTDLIATMLASAIDTSTSTTTSDK